MSTVLKALRAAFATMVLFIGFSGAVRAQGYYDDAYGNSGSYQQFYDELSPYGEWVDDPQYGYVWIPDAGNDFRPYYSNGYWVNSDYGNTWVSNYRWGWAPFHYGRWTYNNYYGWMWIPGNVWGPAWVSWRSGGGCYGWAPLGPGVSVNIAIGGYSCPDYWWTFAPQQYILNPGFHRYCYGPRYAPQYLRQTTIINNTYVYNNRTYLGGPRRQELERAIGRPVQPVSINNTRRPGSTELRGNTIGMYRPNIAASAPQPSERPRRFAEERQPTGGGDAIRQRPATPDFRQGQAAERGGRIPQQDNRAGMRPDRAEWGGRPADVRRMPDNNQDFRQQQERMAQEQQRRNQMAEQQAQRQRDWEARRQLQMQSQDRGSFGRQQEAPARVEQPRGQRMDPGAFGGQPQRSQPFQRGDQPRMSPAPQSEGGGPGRRR